MNSKRVLLLFKEVYKCVMLDTFGCCCFLQFCVCCFKSLCCVELLK